jgi:hypothetical protein
MTLRTERTTEISLPLQAFLENPFLLIAPRKGQAYPITQGSVKEFAGTNGRERQITEIITA